MSDQGEKTIKKDDFLRQFEQAAKKIADRVGSNAKEIRIIKEACTRVLSMVLKENHDLFFNSVSIQAIRDDAFRVLQPILGNNDEARSVLDKIRQTIEESCTIIINSLSGEVRANVASALDSTVDSLIAELDKNPLKTDFQPDKEHYEKSDTFLAILKKQAGDLSGTSLSTNLGDLIPKEKTAPGKQGSAARSIYSLMRFAQDRENITSNNNWLSLTADNQAHRDELCSYGVNRLVKAILKLMEFDQIECNDKLDASYLVLGVCIAVSQIIGEMNKKGKGRELTESISTGILYSVLRDLAQRFPPVQGVLTADISDRISNLQNIDFARGANVPADKVREEYLDQCRTAAAVIVNGLRDAIPVVRDIQEKLARCGNELTIAQDCANNMVNRRVAGEKTETAQASDLAPLFVSGNRTFTYVQLPESGQGLNMIACQQKTDQPVRAVVGIGRAEGRAIGELKPNGNLMFFQDGGGFFQPVKYATEPTHPDFPSSRAGAVDLFKRAAQHLEGTDTSGWGDFALVEKGDQVFVICKRDVFTKVTNAISGSIIIGDPTAENIIKQANLGWNHGVDTSQWAAVELPERPEKKETDAVVLDLALAACALEDEAGTKKDLDKMYEGADEFLSGKANLSEALRAIHADCSDKNKTSGNAEAADDLFKCVTGQEFSEQKLKKWIEDAVTGIVQKLTAEHVLEGLSEREILLIISFIFIQAGQLFLTAFSLTKKTEKGELDMSDLDKPEAQVLASVVLSVLRDLSLKNNKVRDLMNNKSVMDGFKNVDRVQIKSKKLKITKPEADMYNWTSHGKKLLSRNEMLKFTKEADPQPYQNSAAVCQAVLPADFQAGEIRLEGKSLPLPEAPFLVEALGGNGELVVSLVLRGSTDRQSPAGQQHQLLCSSSKLSPNFTYLSLQSEGKLTIAGVKFATAPAIPTQQADIIGKTAKYLFEGGEYVLSIVPDLKEIAGSARVVIFNGKRYVACLKSEEGELRKIFGDPLPDDLRPPPFSTLAQQHSLFEVVLPRDKQIHILDAVTQIALSEADSRPEFAKAYADSEDRSSPGKPPEFVRYPTPQINRMHKILHGGSDLAEAISAGKEADWLAEKTRVLCLTGSLKPPFDESVLQDEKFTPNHFARLMLATSVELSEMELKARAETGTSFKRAPALAAPLLTGILRHCQTVCPQRYNDFTAPENHRIKLTPEDDLKTNGKTNPLVAGFVKSKIQTAVKTGFRIDTDPFLLNYRGDIDTEALAGACGAECLKKDNYVHKPVACDEDVLFVQLSPGQSGSPKYLCSRRDLAGNLQFAVAMRPQNYMGALVTNKCWFDGLELSTGPGCYACVRQNGEVIGAETLSVAGDLICESESGRGPENASKVRGLCAEQRAEFKSGVAEKYQPLLTDKKITGPRVFIKDGSTVYLVCLKVSEARVAAHLGAISSSLSEPLDGEIAESCVFTPADLNADLYNWVCFELPENLKKELKTIDARVKVSGVAERSDDSQDNRKVASGQEKFGNHLGIIRKILSDLDLFEHADYEILKDNGPDAGGYHSGCYILTIPSLNMQVLFSDMVGISTLVVYGERINTVPAKGKIQVDRDELDTVMPFQYQDEQHWEDEIRQAIRRRQNGERLYSFKRKGGIEAQQEISNDMIQALTNDLIDVAAFYGVNPLDVTVDHYKTLHPGTLYLRFRGMLGAQSGEYYLRNAAVFCGFGTNSKRITDENMQDTLRFIKYFAHTKAENPVYS